MDGGNDTTRKLISLASFADSEPDLMEDIADVAGKDVADKIQDAWGGTRITLPIASRVTPDHALSVLVGFENALKICLEIVPASVPLRHVVIPMGDAAAPVRKRLRALELIVQGELSIREIARALHFHERSVWRLRHRLSQNPNRPLIEIARSGTRSSRTRCSRGAADDPESSSRARVHHPSPIRRGDLRRAHPTFERGNLTC